MKVRRVSGFSLTELVVAMAVAMILMAVSLPSFLRAYHSYRLSNAATQVADIVRLTRYEAIRQNRPVICVIQPDSSDPTMTDAFMTDTSGNQMTGSMPGPSCWAPQEIWSVQAQCPVLAPCPPPLSLVALRRQVFPQAEQQFGSMPVVRCPPAT